MGQLSGVPSFRRKKEHATTCSDLLSSSLQKGLHEYLKCRAIWYINAYNMFLLLFLLLPTILMYINNVITFLPGGSCQTSCCPKRTTALLSASGLPFDPNESLPTRSGSRQNSPGLATALGGLRTAWTEELVLLASFAEAIWDTSVEWRIGIPLDIYLRILSSLRSRG